MKMVTRLEVSQKVTSFHGAHLDLSQHPDDRPSISQGWPRRSPGPPAAEHPFQLFDLLQSDFGCPFDLAVS